MEKQKLNEGIELKNSFCKTMEDLINSEDFERVFNIIIKKDKKYNKDYFL